MDSILVTVKKLLGIAYDYDVFDMDLVMYINAALAAAQQLGVGRMGFAIYGEEETWNDFLGEYSDLRIPNLEMIRSYIVMKVRLMWDPPSSSTVVDCLNKAIAEFEWRMNVAVETNVFGGRNPIPDTDLHRKHERGLHPQPSSTLCSGCTEFFAGSIPEQCDNQIIYHDPWTHIDGRDEVHQHQHNQHSF